MTHSHPFEPSHLASARTGTLTSVASLSLCPPPVGSYTVLMCPPPCSSCEPPTSAASSALDRHDERHVERHAAPGASCRAPRAPWTVAPMALPRSLPSQPVPPRLGETSTPSHLVLDMTLLIRRDEHAFPSGARHDAPDEATAARETHSRDTCASARAPSAGAHHGARLTPSAPSSCLLSGKRRRACGRPRAPPRPSARHPRRHSRRHSRPQTVLHGARVLAAPRPQPRQSYR